MRNQDYNQLLSGAITLSEQKSGYNGWPNYETWNVNLWISNDEATDTYFHDLARLYSAGEGYRGNRQAATYELSKMLKDCIIDGTPDWPASLYTDLLSASLDKVDFMEIAASLLEDPIYENLDEK